jgi:dihydrofolate synthase/folylpolyglutamate synthase
MVFSDFFSRYRSLSTEDEMRCALSEYTDLTRHIQRQAPKPERMERFLSFFDHPERRLKVIHLAGTSGKGSTTTMIATLLHAHGFNVGVTISPHLVDIRERIQVNGALIPVSDLCRLLEEVFTMIHERVKDEQELPHFFELMTALAILWFARQQVDYAVIETGLGGRFDATNVIRSSDKFSVFTPIDLDHQLLLGNTRAEIAKEKSGIIVPHGRAWSAPQVPEVQNVLNQETRVLDVYLSYSQTIDSSSVSVTSQGTKFDYHHLSATWPEMRLGAIGVHQAQNATLALDVMHEIATRDQWSVDEQQVRHALASLVLPGRCEVRIIQNHASVIDVAHNPQKIHSLLTTVRTLFPGRTIRMLLGLGSLDHAEPISRLLTDPHLRVAIAAMEVGDVYQKYRLADTEEMAKILTLAGVRQDEPVEDLKGYLENHLRNSPEEVTILTGSFYLISYALPIFNQIC